MILQYSIDARLRARLDARESKGQRRSLAFYPGYDFCSNDYLGLAQYSEPSNNTLSSGSTGSRLISGNHPLTEQFEVDAAQFHGFENSLLFSSGYAANTGLLSCLTQSDDVLILDSLAHASLVDGARLGRAPYTHFEHNDLLDLTKCLDEFEAGRSSAGQRAFVVVESLYSMDGDTAPLQELAALCRTYNAALIVDEAHAVGVYGERGAGLVAQLNLQADVFAAIFTFGKAVGRHGAIIAGSFTLREYLINYSRPFIYSTAPSPQLVASLVNAYQQMYRADEQRQALLSNINYFAKRVKLITFGNAKWLNSDSAIQALVIGDAQQTKVIADLFHSAGFALKAIVSPTVPKGTERIRVCLHSSNTHEQIDRFADVLQDIVRPKLKTQAALA